MCGRCSDCDRERVCCGGIISMVVVVSCELCWVLVEMLTQPSAKFDITRLGQSDGEVEAKVELDGLNCFGPLEYDA